MGNELICKVVYGKQKSEGKALLETSEILFRGDFRLKIPLSTIKSAKAVEGKLRLQTGEGLAIFQLGAHAEKWCEKILHPKSRIEKLGVKPGARVAVIGEFDAELLREVGGLTKSVNKGRAAADSDYIFYAAETKKDLGGGLTKIVKAMQGATALWIVYPKGQKEITEIDVLSTGRKLGLKDVKVVGFSPTHTALKFVIPVSQR